MSRENSPAARRRKDPSPPSFLTKRPLLTRASRNLPALSGPQAYQSGVKVTERLMLFAATFSFHFGWSRSSHETGASFLATEFMLYAIPQWRVNGPEMYFP